MNTLQLARDLAEKFKKSRAFKTVEAVKPYAEAYVNRVKNTYNTTKQLYEAPGLKNKALGVLSNANLAYQLTPAGVAWNVGEAGLASMLKSARTSGPNEAAFGGKENLQKNFLASLSDPYTGVGTAGLGMTGNAGLLVDMFALNPPGFDSKAIKKLLNHPDMSGFKTYLTNKNFEHLAEESTNKNRVISNILFDKPNPALREAGGIGPVKPPKGVGGVERGFVTSVKESPTLNQATRDLTQGIHTPKANEVLMGEAKALLTEGGNIKWGSTKNLDQKVAATIQEAINLDAAGNHEAAAVLFNNLSEHGTELGRGVQAFTMLNKMSPEAISLSAAGLIRKYNETHSKKLPELTGEQQKLISGLVAKIQGMTEGRGKSIAIHELDRTVKNLIPSSLTDKAITVWKAGLLTSLRTHERNLLGNTIMQAGEVVKDLPAAAADRLMGLRTGQRTTTMTLSGLREAGSQATRQQIKDIISMGYDPATDVSKFDVREINWGKGAIEQALKKYTNLVFRTLGAEDKPFYNMAFKRSLYDQAGALAINAKATNKGQFIKDLILKPTKEMLDIATKDASFATFHDKNILSKVSSSIKRAAQAEENGPNASALGKVVTEVLMPFTGVPSSIVGKTIAYSPIGLVKGAVDFGKVMVKNIPELQRQAAQEVGRGVVGTGLFGLGAYLMSKGLMTGQPKDAKEADLWTAQGKQANSVLINGKWRAINSVGPQSLVMLAGAKYAEETGKPEGSMTKYGAGLLKDQMSQTFVQGMAGPINAITDPQRYGTSYVGNTLNSVVPNIVKDVAKANDPNVREMASVPDYLKASIPGLRNTLTEKRDVLGNKIKQEPTGLNVFVDLFNSRTPINNAVVNELSRLNEVGHPATPSKQNKSQTILEQKVKLTQQQLNSLEAGSGVEVQKDLAELIDSRFYQDATDEEKADLISKTVTKARKNFKELSGESVLYQDILNGLVKAVKEKDQAAYTKYKTQAEAAKLDPNTIQREITLQSLAAAIKAKNQAEYTKWKLKADYYGITLSEVKARL